MLDGAWTLELLVRAVHSAWSAGPSDVFVGCRMLARRDLHDPVGGAQTTVHSTVEHTVSVGIRAVNTVHSYISL